MGRTGDDIIKMKEAGHLGSFANVLSQARRHPREVFAQISVNNSGGKFYAHDMCYKHSLGQSCCTK